MSKTLVFSVSAAKACGKLPAAVQERILAALYRYGVTGSGDIKPMVGSVNLRMREGDYRVILIEHSDTLEIRAVGHRRDVYR